MTRPIILPGLLLYVMASLCEVAPARSQVPDFPRPPAFPGRTSSFFHFISCVNVRDGALLNCEFRDAILGLKPPSDALENNGGHQHDSGHPLIDNIPTGGFACVDCTDANPEALVVQGMTNNREVSVLHALPEVTGQIQGRIITTLPRGFVCVEDCAPLLFTVDVRVPGLQPFPDNSLLHITIRGGRGTHPEGTHSTQRTQELLTLIALEYCKSALGLELPLDNCLNSRRRLSINDLSLPKGGMFDLCSTWNPADTCPNPDNPKQMLKGHATHRTGTDADINNEDEGGNLVGDCEEGPLKRAVRRVIPPGDALKCEVGGGKHVDFD